MRARERSRDCCETDPRPTLKGRMTSPPWSPGNLRHSSRSSLVLLPSGPDTVRRATMHRARAPCRARAETVVAERAGFEPAVELPPHTLSKRAPSASRTPLLTPADVCEKTSYFNDLAERKGFEPLDLVKGQRFSRPPRSTTPAPLRKRASYSTTIPVVWQRTFAGARGWRLRTNRRDGRGVDRGGDLPRDPA